MLPFLKHNKEAGTTVLPESIKRYHDDDFDMVESAAEDLIQAIHAKDVKAVAQALRSAFEICDAMPHEEGPHEG